MNGNTPPCDYGLDGESPIRVIDNWDAVHRNTIERIHEINDIWMVSREYGALAGAGGVKDVVFQLAKALVDEKRKVSVILPRYGFMSPEASGFTAVMDPLHPYQELVLLVRIDHPDQPIDEVVRFHTKEENGVTIYLVEGERFREKRAVYTYTEEEHRAVNWKIASTGHIDYFAMNVLLQKASLDLLIALHRRPDIIHCHDGHTALLPAMIREIPGYGCYFRGTSTVVTLHNAGRGYHQEISDLPFATTVSGLPRRIIDENRLENKFDPFLVAGNYALLNTVSENYACELIATDSDYMTGWLGHTLKARNIALYGITNGIDPELYNTRTLRGGEPAFRFNPADAHDDMSGKTRCRRALEELLAKDIRDGVIQEGVKQHGSLCYIEGSILFSFVGRINQDKGVDWLIAVLPPLLQRYPNAQVIVLGNGDTNLEEQLIFHANLPEYAGRFCFLEGYGPNLAPLVYAAGDFFLIPSRFEPCGLTDFIAQLYGNIPIVHHVGGLVKVKDGKTGITYTNHTAESLLEALERAIHLPENERRQIQIQAVQEIFTHYTWKKVKDNYLRFYVESRLHHLNSLKK